MAEKDESATPGNGRFHVADNVCEPDSSDGIRVPERHDFTIRDNSIIGSGGIPIT
jgi:hypothetical protein